MTNLELMIGETCETSAEELDLSIPVKLPEKVKKKQEDRPLVSPAGGGICRESSGYASNPALKFYENIDKIGKGFHILNTLSISTSKSGNRLGLMQSFLLYMSGSPYPCSSTSRKTITVSSLG